MTMAEERPYRRLQLAGEVFDRLTAIRDVGAANDKGRLWLCRCECGNETTVKGSDLRKGHTRSCGCFNKEQSSLSRRKHGHSMLTGEAVRTYRSWQHMLRRCSSPGSKDFKYYGARGISVCERWADFAAFLADMGEKPLGRSLDRINNDGNYEPGNCRWATHSEQMRNRRPNGSCFK